MLSLLFALNVNTADACPMADAEAAAANKARVESIDDATKVTFAVEGMTCGSCSEKVTKALEGVDGVTAAAVDYQKGTAIVAFDSEKTDQDKLLAAITDLGFKAEKPNS